MNFRKLAEGVNVSPLLAELQARPHLWNRNDARLSERGPHYETDDIWLRYKDETENLEKGDYANFSDAHDPIWYPAYAELPSAKPLIFDLMRAVLGERLGGVLLYRVPAGKQIYPHTDIGWHVDYYDKFNICLQSNPRAAFFYEEDAMLARAGDVHYFVNNKQHWVRNEGKDDHIVLTVCLKSEAFKCHSAG